MKKIVYLESKDQIPEKFEGIGWKEIFSLFQKISGREPIFIKINQLENLYRIQVGESTDYHFKEIATLYLEKETMYVCGENYDEILLEI